MGLTGLLRRYRGRFVLLGVVVLLFGLPSLATGSSKHGSAKSPKLPACRHFSGKTIKKLIYGDTDLHFKGSPGGDICAFLGHLKGRYQMAVNVALEPGSESLFLRLEASAEKAAKDQGATFKIVKNGNPAIFEYSQIQSGSGLGMCSPAKKLPVTGPPSCNGEPSWWHQDAWAYGTLKGTKTKIIVATEIYAELGDAGSNSAVDLTQDVLSKKLK
jgi:hypothetical protein